MKLNHRVVWTLAVFAALIVLLGAGLRLNPREVPSPLVGKPAPAFELPRFDDPGVTFKSKDMIGQVWMLNVWASWCVACRVEHPALLALAKTGAVPLYGLNYKDSREDGLPWLKKLGDPYVHSLFDADGRIGIDYGVYGVPETYVIDAKGIIRYKRIGPLTDEIIRTRILPLVADLKQAG